MRVKLIYTKMMKRLMIFGFIFVMFFPVITNAQVSINDNISYLDFGDIIVETADTKAITITNNYTESIYVSLRLSAGVFTIDKQSMNLDPAGITRDTNSMDVNVTFTPLDTVNYSVTLYIDYSYNDVRGNIPVVLAGTGIEEPEPEEPEQPTIADLLMNFDSAVIDKTLVGVGGGKSKQNTTKAFDKLAAEDADQSKTADNRLSALRNMIVNAASLIENGSFEEACGQLSAASKKIDDGASESPAKGNSIFATGEAASGIKDQIQKLINSLL